MLDHKIIFVRKRYAVIDYVRGLGACFIVIYHFFCNLRILGVLAPPEVSNSGKPIADKFWFALYFGVNLVLMRKVKTMAWGGVLSVVYFVIATSVCIFIWWFTSQEAGVALLMFVLGWSSAVRHDKAFDSKYVVDRCLKLFFVCSLLSVTSWILFPDQWIYFGALHCILLNSALHLPFVLSPQVSAGTTVGFALVVLLYTPIFGRFPLEVPVYKTLDLIPWFHNFGFVLLGVAAGKKKFHFRFTIDHDDLFVRAGKHALKIYLYHQFLLFPIAIGIRLI